MQQKRKIRVRSRQRKDIDPGLFVQILVAIARDRYGDQVAGEETSIDTLGAQIEDRQPPKS